MALAKNSPKDAQVMASILKEVAVQDYDPRVLNQMLEFTYRYVTNILEDSQQFSTHARKKAIDMDDVRLAMELYVDRHFTPPPPRELLLEVSRHKNSSFLPLIKSTAGPRLPPDRYNLTACNYRLKSNKKQKVVTTIPRTNLASLQSNSLVNKLNPAITLSNKGGGLSVVTKSIATPIVTVVPRSTINATMPKVPQTPIIKFSNGNPNMTSVSATIPYSTSSMHSSQMMMSSMIKTEPPDHGEKRKRDDDDDIDYDS